MAIFVQNKRGGNGSYTKQASNISVGIQEDRERQFKLFYKSLYPELQVDVILYKTMGNFVYVLGEVKRGGAFPINRPISMHEALALAGGLTPEARLEDTILAHRRGDVMKCQRVNFADKILLGGEHRVALLRPDDIVFVPKRRLATVAQIAREISDVTFFNGWNLGFSWELYSDDD